MRRAIAWDLDREEVERRLRALGWRRTELVRARPTNLRRETWCSPDTRYIQVRDDRFVGSVLVVDVQENDAIDSLTAALQLVERADLLARLHDPAARVRAARGLAAAVDTADAAVVEALIPLSQDADPEVRTALLDAAARLGSASLLPQVTALATDPDATVAEQAERLAALMRANPSVLRF